MSRGAIPQREWGSGLGTVTSSMSRAPKPFFSVKLKNLGQLDLKIPATYYGDELTWGILGGLNIKWGNETTLLYDGLQPGWSYVWNLGRKTFTVTDDKGTAVVHQNVVTMSDLGITCDILESHNFQIYIDASFDNDAFLICWIYKKGYPPDPDNPYDPDDPDDPTNQTPTVTSIIQMFSWGEADKYLNSIMKIAFGRLIGISKKVVDQTIVITSDESTIQRQILSAKVFNLSGTGFYPQNLLQGDQSISLTRKTLIRQAEMWILGNALMITSLASLNQISAPYVAPWLLWDLWRWIGRSNVVVTKDRCFDLIPWG